ncbi:hypothetical protein GNZ12_43310 [Paraburkholderia sp. 1N]|uniref:Uncharacterized protein n=1 Tax=Paraburkholderia solitsugae TaxID=2675748 RepID=A0ABX2C4R7_9BURK|nr:hypothetical protein [Paraburkholderia solitsugae]
MAIDPGARPGKPGLSSILFSLKTAKDTRRLDDLCVLRDCSTRRVPFRFKDIHLLENGVPPDGVSLVNFSLRKAAGRKSAM